MKVMWMYGIAILSEITILSLKICKNLNLLIMIMKIFYEESMNALTELTYVLEEKVYEKTDTDVCLSVVYFIFST